MDQTETKRERIKAKVAASQARLKRDSQDGSIQPHRLPNLPDAYPPENYRSLAAEYPVLAVGIGLGLGLLAGALVPKRKGSRFGRTAIALASTAAEVALTLSQHARTAVTELEQDGAEKLARATVPARRTVKRIASSAGSRARTAASTAAREAVRLVTKARQGD
ncbi:hypothetical protein [Novosphingobium sp.]|uniref:hypothetical protein n=1 Tax=Novosphingobium sp. TaxID=1874826 RepID=UPI0025D386EE|nr:hypothetical protein [Novosphingobium sp.]